MPATRTSRPQRRRSVLALLAAAGGFVILAAAAPPSQGPTITGIAVPKSTWMAMTVAVSYDHSNARDTLTLGVRWRRLNGERLDFTPATARIVPGHGEVILDTKYHGVLPPPTPIILHLELTGPNGRQLAQRDCRMTLVTPQGKEAWAADLMRKKSRDLSWRVKECT